MTIKTILISMATAALLCGCAEGYGVGYGYGPGAEAVVYDGYYDDYYGSTMVIGETAASTIGRAPEIISVMTTASTSGARPRRASITSAEPRTGRAEDITRVSHA